MFTSYSSIHLLQGVPGPKNQKGQIWPNLAKFGQTQFQKGQTFKNGHFSDNKFQKGKMVTLSLIRFYG
jgi:hypothetical protein